jgi:hypothetical protein
MTDNTNQGRAVIGNATRSEKANYRLFEDCDIARVPTPNIHEYKVSVVSNGGHRFAHETLSTVHTMWVLWAPQCIVIDYLSLRYAEATRSTLQMSRPEVDNYRKIAVLILQVRITRYHRNFSHP